MEKSFLSSTNGASLDQVIPVDLAGLPTAVSIVPRKLDAEEYHAEDQEGVTQSLFGSGNLNYMMLQGRQTNDALSNSGMNSAAGRSEIDMLGGGYATDAQQRLVEGLSNGGAHGSIDSDIAASSAVIADHGRANRQPVGDGAFRPNESGHSTTHFDAVSFEVGGTAAAVPVTAGIADRMSRGDSDGQAGRDGRSGADGSNGTNGANGINGSSGAVGQNGVDGNNGVDASGGQTIIIDNSVTNITHVTDITEVTEVLPETIINIVNEATTLVTNVTNQLLPDVVSTVTNTVYNTVVQVPGTVTDVVGQVTDIVDNLGDAVTGLLDGLLGNQPGSGDYDLAVHNNLGLPQIDVNLDVLESVVGDIDILVNLANGDDGLTVGLDTLVLGVNLPGIEITVPTGAVEDAVHQLADGDVTGAIGTVVDGVNEGIVAPVVDTAGEVLDYLSDVTGGALLEPVSDIVAAVPGIVDDVVGQLANDGLPDVSETLGDVIDTVAGITDGVIPAPVTDVLEVAADTAGNIVDGIIGNADEGIVGQVIDVVATAPSVVTDALEELGGGDLGGVVDTVTGLVEGLTVGAPPAHGDDVDLALHNTAGLPQVDLNLDPVEQLVGDVDIHVDVDIDDGLTLSLETGVLGVELPPIEVSVLDGMDEAGDILLMGLDQIAGLDDVVDSALALLGSAVSDFDAGGVDLVTSLVQEPVAWTENIAGAVDQTLGGIADGVDGALGGIAAALPDPIGSVGGGLNLLGGITEKPGGMFGLGGLF